MAFPSVVGTPVESSLNTAGTSHIISLPSLASGNLCIILVNIGSTAATFNALSGWTEILDENTAGGCIVIYRWCDGTEGATVTFTSSASTRGAYIVYEISGAINPATQPPQINSVATGTSTAPDPSSLTPSGGAKDYLWLAFFGAAGEEADDDTWCNNGPSTPGTWTNLRQKACGTLGTNLGGKIASAQSQQNATTVDPNAFSQDVSTAWRAFTIAIHPALVVTITDVETDEDVENRDRDVTITGTGFLASQGDGTVELADNAVYASATNIVPQIVQSWSDTSIDFMANLHIGSVADELAPGTVYVFVKNSGEVRNTTGFAITVNAGSALKFVAGGTQEGGAGGNGYTIPIPDGTWLGDVLICAWIKQVTDVPSVDGFNTEGWTRFPGSPYEQTSGGFKYEVDIAWKIQTAEIEDNIGFNWDASSTAISHVFLAYAEALEAVQLVAEIETTQDDQPVHPGITIERSNSGLIYIYATNVDGTASAPPTGFVERLDSTTLVSAGDDLTTTPGATGSITGSLVNPEWPSMFLIEIATEPAPVPPKPTRVLTAVGRAATW